MQKTKVALCIPAFGSQPPEFWVPLVEQIGAALKSGVEIMGPVCESSMAADRNRNAIVRRMLKSDADWTYWQDADNINPAGTLNRLLDTAGSQRKVVSGLYFMKKKPFRPVAYRRLPDGRYINIRDWERGEILEVDAMGMNCALIHREVFETIDQSYVALQRASGGIVPVHREDIRGDVFGEQVSDLDGKVKDGIWHQRVWLPKEVVDVPFFFSEYNRTEDMAFFEMAKRVGYSLWVDTSIECGHLDWRVVRGKDYRMKKSAGSGAAGGQI
ncbi:MAG: hypothetical protein FVQ83_14915 [Chloroflexi bacterium]|nr:hypothetical protein [Chloroflexota bacterium]